MKMIMKRILIALLILLTSLSVFAAEANSDGVLSLVPVCDTEGRLTLTVSSFDIPSEYWVYTEDIDLWLINDKGSAVNLNDKGTWSRERIKDSPDLNQRTAVFTTTGVDSIHNAGAYKIKVNYLAGASKDIDKRNRAEVAYEQEKPFYCGGYVFSCSELAMSVDKCTSDGKTLRIEHTIKGLSQSPKAIIDPYSINYYLQTEKPYLDAYGKTSVYGDMPKGSKITSLGNDKYLLESPLVDNQAQAVTIAYDLYVNKYTMDCVNKEGLVLAAGAECTAQETQEVKEETKTEETQEGNGITGAAVTTPSTYSTKTKLLIAGIVVLVIIIAGYFLTKKDDNITPTEERKE